MTPRAKKWRTESGGEVTEADAARLAEEFEGDDTALEEAAITYPRKVGRPSLSGRTAASPQVTFRMPPALRAAAERVAAQRGTTLSGLAREALEELVRHSA
jgi:predicted HicB family RNase H-like nuclease